MELYNSKWMGCTRCSRPTMRHVSMIRRIPSRSTTHDISLPDRASCLACWQKTGYVIDFRRLATVTSFQKRRTISVCAIGYNIFFERSRYPVFSVVGILYEGSSNFRHHLRFCLSSGPIRVHVELDVVKYDVRAGWKKE